jgi:hypothetical protein
LSTRGNCESGDIKRKLKIKTPLQVLRAELRIKKTLFYPPRFGGFLVVLVMRER